MQKLQIKIKISFIAASLLIGCQHSAVTPLHPRSQIQSVEISVMSFNVENLFDAKHDPDREDFTYLPLQEKKSPDVQKFCASMKNKTYRAECEQLDWNENIVQTKLKNIAQVIRSIDEGKGPDCLLLAEVENESILKRLVQEGLGGLGYQTVVLLEGPDTRGIDPAFISKFKLQATPKLHLIPYEDPDPEQLKWAKRSRGILEVTVQAPNQKNITFLVAHFPSQSNPSSWRSQAVDYAQKLMSDYIKQGRSVVLGGDLNITDQEETEKGYFKNKLSQVGQVSHLVGCKQCLGSHYYRGEWSHLDVLVFSNNMTNNGFELIPDSIEVVHAENHVNKNGTPKRFNPENAQGVSDHFPLYSRLRILK